VISGKHLLAASISPFGPEAEIRPAPHRGSDACFSPYQSTRLRRMMSYPEPGGEMKRREFITLLGGAAVAWPLGAQAQQPATVPRIGWIAIGTPQGSEFLGAVKQGLRQLGYVEGRSIIIETRWPTDIRDRVPELVRELLALNVQVIVTQGAIVPLVRRVIDSTPVVFGYSGDPVEAGLVNSFSRPGGNFTGATFMSYEVNAKRVELLREAFPHVTRVAILSNPLHPGEQRELKESEQGAKRLEIGVSYAQMPSAAEIEPAFERIRAAGAEAMIALPDGLVMQHRKRIIEFAVLQRIPVISGWSEFAKSGGTMTYGPNLNDSFQRLATYVDKILKGANPGELAVEQPTKFELVINLKAAKAIGLEVSPILLGRADEVIE
jgi:putative tryptophan/tyrosine transport system substrate-binding protein